MSGTIKKYLTLGILILMLIMILAQVAPDIFSETEAVADNTSLPGFLRTVFSFLGWVPITLLAVGVLTVNFGSKAGRYFRRRRR